MSECCPHTCICCPVDLHGAAVSVWSLGFVSNAYLDTTRVCNNSLL